MNISFRKTTDSDFALCRDIHHACYKDVVIAQFCQWDVDFQDRSFKESWNQCPMSMIMANKSVAGCLALQEDGATIKLHELLVLPEYQGKGIGTYVLNEMINRARKTSSRLWLRVLHLNRARQLYLRLGFIDIGKDGTGYIMELPSNKALNRTLSAPVSF